jgi:dihydrofolate synthase/folylpolyglutamate synthase
VRVPPDALYEGRLSLRGPHQRRNAAIAEAVLAALPAAWRPPEEAIAAAFARVRLPGRYDRRGRWLFDVAHNPDGLAALLAALAADPPSRPLHAVVCVLRDKNWPAMLHALAGAVDRLWLTDAPSAPADRAWDLSAAAALLGPRAVVERDLGRALDDAAQGAGTVLVTGSFHTVGDAMARLPGFQPLG